MGPLSDPQLDLELPARPDYVVVARHAVAALARLGGLTDEVVETAKIAVSEACTNAVARTAESARGEPVVVRAAADDAALVIEVFDRGSRPPPDIAAGTEQWDSQDFSFEKNLSMPLIRGLVPEVELVPRDGGGSIVRMRLPVQGGEEEE